MVVFNLLVPLSANALLRFFGPAIVLTLALAVANHWQRHHWSRIPSPVETIVVQSILLLIYAMLFRSELGFLSGAWHEWIIPALPYLLGLIGFPIMLSLYFAISVMADLRPAKLLMLAAFLAGVVVVGPGLVDSGGVERDEQVLFCCQLSAASGLVSRARYLPLLDRLVDHFSGDRPRGESRGFPFVVGRLLRLSRFEIPSPTARRFSQRQFVPRSSGSRSIRTR